MTNNKRLNTQRENIMKTAATATISALFIGLTTIGAHALEIAPNNIVSPSTCNQYTDIKRKNICLNIVEIEQEIEASPARLNKAQITLKHAQDLKKKILLSIDTHFKVLDSVTTHTNSTIRNKAERYMKYDFEHQLSQQNKKIDAVIQTAKEEISEAEEAVEAIPTLKLIRDGHKAQLEILENIEEK